VTRKDEMTMQNHVPQFPRVAIEQKTVGFSQKPRIAFETLGCKANLFDSDNLIQACKQIGFEIVSFQEEADAYVVNTCTVTASADRQGRNLLRRANRTNPHALVIATGCSAEMQKDMLWGIDGVDAVFGTSERKQVLEYLIQAFDFKGNVDDFDQAVPLKQSRARAQLKIQEGCDNRCTFCLIWRARGKSQSKEKHQLVEDAKRLVANSYEEIILTGIHIGSYGLDLPGQPKLSELIEALLSQTKVKRIRLSSLDPECVDEKIVWLYQNEPRLCRYLHLSMQSASDDVIKEMRRKSKSFQARKLIEKLAATVPDIAISADIIAGFPGETEVDHKMTYDFLSELPFSWVHVFPFSARQGTAAARRPDKLDLKIVKQRAKELNQIAEKKRVEFYQRQLGKSLTVIVTSKEVENGFIKAVSDNDVPIWISYEGNKNLYGKMITAHVTNVQHLRLEGTWEFSQSDHSSYLRKNLDTDLKTKHISLAP